MCKEMLNLLEKILDEQKEQTKILQSIESRLEETNSEYFNNILSGAITEFKKVTATNPETIHLLLESQGSFGAQSTILKKLLFSF